MDSLSESRWLVEIGRTHAYQALRSIEPKRKPQAQSAEPVIVQVPTRTNKALRENAG